MDSVTQAEQHVDMYIHIDKDESIRILRLCVRNCLAMAVRYGDARQAEECEAALELTDGYDDDGRD